MTEEQAVVTIINMHKMNINIKEEAVSILICSICTNDRSFRDCIHYSMYTLFHTLFHLLFICLFLENLPIYSPGAGLSLNPDLDQSLATSSGHVWIKS